MVLFTIDSGVKSPVYAVAMAYIGLLTPESLFKGKLIMTVCKFNAIIYQGIDIGGVING